MNTTNIFDVIDADEARRLTEASRDTMLDIFRKIRVAATEGKRQLSIQLYDNDLKDIRNVLVGYKFVCTGIEQYNPGEYCMMISW